MIVVDIGVTRKDSADVPIGEVDRADFRQSDSLCQDLAY